MPSGEEHDERQREQEKEGEATPSPLLFLSQFFNRWLRVGEDLICGPVRRFHAPADDGGAEGSAWARRASAVVGRLASIRAFQ